MNADDIRTAIKLWLITLDGEGRSPYTLKSYQAHMHMFLKWLGERELDVFTWRLFMSEIRKTYSPYTCRTLCATARSFVGFCIREGILEDDSLLKKMKLPRVPDTPRNTLSAGQVKAMAAYLSSDRRSYGVRNYAAVALLLDTGLRAGELLELQLDDMVDDDYLRVRRSKNGKPRLVPMGAKSQKALMRYLTLARPQLEPRCNSLFVGDGKGHHRDRGQPWTRHGIQCFFQRLSKKLGFKVTAHLMRHTFTTQALRAGADIETIRRIAGWTDYRMIMTYAHLQADDLREKHRKFSPFDRLG